jgi:hypothetical protein
MPGWSACARVLGGKFPIIWLFVLCALPVGVMTALITPPGQSPDEIAHTSRALGLLHGELWGERKTDIYAPTGKPQADAGVQADAGIVALSAGKTTQIGDQAVVTSNDFLAMRAMPEDHRLVFATAPNTVVDFPAAYLPAAFGLGLGLTVNAPPYICFELARLGMLTAFMILGAAALWIAAYGEAVLLAVLLLPMTLFLAGTVNQDGVLIAMATLAGAALTRQGRRWWLLALLLVTLLCCAKTPYILLLGMFFLPWSGTGFWPRGRAVAIACVPIMGWAILTMLFIRVPFIKGFYYPGPLYTGNHGVLMDHTDPLGNFRILLADPARFFSLPLHTINLIGIYELHMAVGILGLINIKFSADYYVAWGLACLAAVLGLFISERPYFIPRRTALFEWLSVIGLLAASVWLIMILSYVSWADLGMDWIDGLEGRYLLPLAPFLIFAVPVWPGRLRVPALVPAIPVLVMGLLDIGYVPVKLVWSYYLH